MKSIKKNFIEIFSKSKKSSIYDGDNYFTYLNSENKPINVLNKLNKKMLIGFISAFVLVLIIFVLLFTRKKQVEYIINNIIYDNNEIVLSINSDKAEEYSLNDILKIEYDNVKIIAPVVDNTLFLNMNDDYIKVNGKELTIGSKYVNAKNKYNNISGKLKISVNKKNAYKYGDYLTRNNLNKTSIRDYKNEYDYIKYMTLLNTNIDYSIFDIDNNTNTTLFKKIFADKKLNSLILLNTNIDTIMSYVRSNSNKSSDPINTVFSENRILAIDTLDYSNLDNLYKNFNRLIKLLYNVDGPFIITNSIDNDEIIIYNLLINALQNLSYDEMLNNYINYYKSIYKIEDENKTLELNFKTLITHILNIDEKADLKNMSFKTIINDYLDGIDELTLNYIVNKISLNLKGDINE